MKERKTGKIRDNEEETSFIIFLVGFLKVFRLFGQQFP